MRKILARLSLGLLVALSSAVGAATLKKASVRKTSGAAVKGIAKTTSRGHLQTDVSFDDSVLRGEYQAPEEALAKVENEKGLGDLIGVRKHFKDRLSTASEQE